MPNNTVQTGGGGNGTIKALLAILVIAVIAFGIWFVMRDNAPATQQQNENGGALEIEIGTGGQNQDGQEGGQQQPRY
ncbi:MAG: hypothetical protein UY63_C0003G0028 [Parcubacteria group bacterium GW2011_GWA2_51_10]|nr:MAG: hypothetical protein UY63_C0003G0028 [Parcubacteria group bacterium GW2011_GWA2_51_10]